MMLDRFAEAVEKLGRERLDLSRSAHVHQQQRELITAEPRDEVVRSNRELQPVGEGAEECVPCIVAKGVVGQLELVDVEEKQRIPFRRPFAARQRVQLALEQRSVGQASKRIVKC